MIFVASQRPQAFIAAINILYMITLRDSKASLSFVKLNAVRELRQNRDKFHYSPGPPYISG
jgi:hypothetical protein